MRKIFLTLIITLFIGCAGIALDNIAEEELKVQEIIEVDLTKNEIYSLSLQWMANTFVDSKEVVEVKDAESGRLIGKGITYFTSVVVEIPCRYTITIEAKEGRARVTIDSFTALWGEYHNKPRPVGKYKGERGILEDVKGDAAALINDLSKHLNKSKSDSDW